MSNRIKQSGKPFSVSEIFGSSGTNQLPDSPDIHISWKTNGAYKIYYNTKRFFTSPKPARELNLLDQVNSLLNTTGDEPTEEVIKKCRNFIHLHRVTENTSARKRLERWAKRIIVIYLLTVLFLVVACSNRFYPLMAISDTVMITILSTTTVNIIGLGLIVLRGHFFLKEKESDMNKEDQAIQEGER